MRDDEIALVVCSPQDAEFLLEQEPDLSGSLIVTSVLEPGNMYMLPEEEFKEYLIGGCVLKKELVEKIRHSSKYNSPCPEWVYKLIENS